MLLAQVTDAFLSTINTALRGGILATPDMGLFINTPTLTVDSLLADLTEPTYTGYARAALVLEAVRKDLLGSYIQPFASALFQPTNNTNLPEQINGYFVMATIAAVDTLLYAEYFDSPEVLSTSASGISVIFDGYVKNLLTWGGYCAVC